MYGEGQNRPPPLLFALHTGLTVVLGHPSPNRRGRCRLLLLPSLRRYRRRPEIRQRIQDPGELALRPAPPHRQHPDRLCPQPLLHRPGPSLVAFLPLGLDLRPTSRPSGTLFPTGRLLPPLPLRRLSGSQNLRSSRPLDALPFPPAPLLPLRLPDCPPGGLAGDPPHLLLRRRNLHVPPPLLLRRLPSDLHGLPSRREEEPARMVSDRSLSRADRAGALAGSDFRHPSPGRSSGPLVREKAHAEGEVAHRRSLRGRGSSGSSPPALHLSDPLRFLVGNPSGHGVRLPCPPTPLGGSLLTPSRPLLLAPPHAPGRYRPPCRDHSEGLARHRPLVSDRLRPAGPLQFHTPPMVGRSRLRYETAHQLRPPLDLRIRLSPYPRLPEKGVDPLSDPPGPAPLVGELLPHQGLPSSSLPPREAPSHRPDLGVCPGRAERGEP